MAMLALGGCSSQMLADMEGSEAYANLAEGDAFLKENRKQEGVIELHSGLQYKVLREGSGPTPTEGSLVSIHYKGTYIDGRVFESSYGKRRPPKLKVNQTLRGMRQALMKMKEGAKWMLYVPPELAYGESGMGGIGPNKTLIFELELLKVH